MILHEAFALAKELMQQHGLDGWEFHLDNGKKRFGCCRHDKKWITMSQALIVLNDEPEVRETLLHEIAHALTPGHGHNSRWQQVAKSIGCTGKRCYDSELVVQPMSRYIGECPICGKIFKRSRKPRSPMFHRGCAPTYAPQYRIVWRDRGR